MKSFQVVVIGGGTGGLFTSSRLNRIFKSVAIIEPADTHYYQPLWTLVGAGIVKKEDTARPMGSVIPSGVTWVKNKAMEFFPTQNKIVLDSGEEVAYEFLVVSPGIQINWQKIDGLKGFMGRDGICSNYEFNTVDSTWRSLQEFKGGIAVFTMPPTPFKCPGAAQKIMWLAEEYFRTKGIRNKTKVYFVSSAKAIFGIPKYKAALEVLVKKRGIETVFNTNLTGMDPLNKTLTGTNLVTGEKMQMNYDMIHITPPQGPLDFIKNSPLSNQDGWVDVDQYTLQHKKFPNIFSCGDSSSLPIAKTGAAIRKQAPVLVQNLYSLSKGENIEKNYNGYTSCPLITEKGKCIMAEFGYEDKVMESFPFDQGKERLSMYILKKDILPLLYWNLMIKGYM
jgi:sulfide:quinone oxidoreductase